MEFITYFNPAFAKRRVCKPPELGGSTGAEFRSEVMGIAALYVLSNGPYKIDGIDLWDDSRDARKFKGPSPVIAHPPCERWGRYWGGGPMRHGTEKQLILGDDEGCFAHALWAVRTFSGVLEHPEASHAFKFFGLPIPNQKGGWTEPDRYGGRSSCVAQGNYGHRAEKLTWLYGVRINFKELIWGRKPGMMKIDQGFHTKEERARLIKTGICQRLSKRQRTITPEPFRDLLIDLLNKPQCTQQQYATRSGNEEI